MVRTRILVFCVILLAALVGFFIYSSQSPESSFNFKLGLDLDGGTQLIYRADISNISQEKEALEALRDVIERRVNVFGVSEPLVQLEEAGSISGSAEHRLIVELPGVTDIEKAIEVLGQTPLLEFKLQRENLPKTEEELNKLTAEEIFISTELTGRFLDKAELQFIQNGGLGISEPTVLLKFDKEGQKLFADITRENKGKFLAIFLDGAPISTPVIREEISDGNAVISGAFSIEEARELVRNLNLGALPVPIELVSSQIVGATLGSEATEAGIKAGVVGFVLVSLFLLLWYRLPGLVAIISLAMYIIVTLALFKLIPVILTAAAIAGFVMSIGMAVDANVLVFERLREERKKGQIMSVAINESFARAWSSIRDSNISNLITATILFWFGTSLIKGFALVLFLGVIVNTFITLFITKLFLLAYAGKELSQPTKISSNKKY